jgi:hypothetical protein
VDGVRSRSIGGERRQRRRIVGALDRSLAAPGSRSGSVVVVFVVIVVLGHEGSGIVPVVASRCRGEVGAKVRG